MRAALGGYLGDRLGGWRWDLAHTIWQFRHAGRISLPHVEITNASVNQCPRIIVSVRDKAKIFPGRRCSSTGIEVGLHSSSSAAVVDSPDHRFPGFVDSTPGGKRVVRHPRRYIQ